MATKCTDPGCTDKNCKNIGGNCDCPDCKKKKAAKGNGGAANYKGPVQSAKQAAAQDKSSGNKKPAPYSPAEAKKEAFWQRMQKGR